MKIIKSVSLNKPKFNRSKDNIKLKSKKEISVIKVLSKIGLATINELNGSIIPTFSRENGNLKVTYIKEIPRSRDQVRTISTCFPKYRNNNSTLKGSIITYIFSTEKGMLSVLECINYGIGGKLIGFVTID